MAEPKALRHATSYAEHRAAEYPDVGDGLDAAMKGLAAYHRGEPLPSATLAWIERCEAVKARFPKPAPNSTPSAT